MLRLHFVRKRRKLRTARTKEGTRFPSVRRLSTRSFKMGRDIYACRGNAVRTDDRRREASWQQIVSLQAQRQERACSFPTTAHSPVAWPPRSERYLRNTEAQDAFVEAEKFYPPMRWSWLLESVVRKD